MNVREKENGNNMKIYDDEYGIEIFPSGKLYRISYDSATNKMRLRCFNRQDLDDIINSFSDVNPASFFMKQYGYEVDNKVYIVNKFGYFPTGMFFEIVKFIKLRYGSLSILSLSENVKKYVSDYLVPLKSVLNGNVFEISNISDDSGRNEELVKQGKNPYGYRDYQKTAVEKLIFNGFGRGMISLPTASGKSLCICNLIYNIQKNIKNDAKCLILVPNKQLVSQMYNDFVDYGYPKYDVTKFTAGLKKNEQFDPNAKVVVANRQYVFTNSERLLKFDILFCDEVHQCWNAESTRKFIENLDCKMKFGCSGSIPKQKYGRWILNGMFGNIVHTEEITDMQRRGFISNLKLYQINVTDTVVQNDRNYLFHLNPLRRYSPDENGISQIAFNEAHEAEHDYYEQHYKDLYVPPLKYISQFKENTLVLFDRIEFGKRLFEISHNIFKDMKLFYIDGSVDVKDRLRMVEEIEKSDGHVLFAERATFSTGINAKRLTNLVFVSSSKSFPFILQSIGRTLRLHSTKNESRIFDINFNFKYSRKHLLERLKIYKEQYNKTPDQIVDIKI